MLRGLLAALLACAAAQRVGRAANGTLVVDGGTGDVLVVGGGMAAALLAELSALRSAVGAQAAELGATRAELGVARDGASPRGKLFAVGGYTGTDFLASAERFSPVTNSWQAAAPMAVARYAFGCALFDGHIYTAGGANEDLLAAVERYDPSADTWERLKDLPAARRVFQLVVAGGRLLSIGGSTPATVRSVLRYEPATDSWAAVASTLEERSHICAAVESGLVYVAGNYPPTASVEVYDPSAGAGGTWTLLPARLKTGRYSCGAASLGGRVFVVGGGDGGNPLASVEVYDPRQAGLGWREVAPMRTGREGPAVAAQLGRLVAVGGGSVTSGEAYDPATDAWVPIASMSAARGHPCLVLVE